MAFSDQTSGLRGSPVCPCQVQKHPNQQPFTAVLCAATSSDLHGASGILLFLRSLGSRALFAILCRWLMPCVCETLGRDMGGYKTYGGRKMYQRTRSPENFWPPPKELLACSTVDSCTGKTEHRHLRGVENVRYEGGSKTPFWEGCHS